MLGRDRMITTLFGGGAVPALRSPSPPAARLPPRKVRAVESESLSLDEQGPIVERYDEGKFLQAYELARAHGPLNGWKGTSARILAGRLAGNLGGIRLGHALVLRAARADPHSPMARCHAARSLLDRQGAATTWAWMRSRGDLKEGPAELRADWVALQAVIAARFRDFETAWSLLRRAEGIAPSGPSRLLERAWILEQQDDHSEALEAAQEAIRLQPSYPIVIREVARLLHIAGRSDEARTLLCRAMVDTECGSIAAMLALLDVEQGRLEEGRRGLDRFEALSPLLDPRGRCWLAAQRSDLLYKLGDMEGSRRQARLARDPFHAAVSERIVRAGSVARRVRLPVPFVQQHHKTCTPAALASLSRYWGRPLDQEALAQAMTYDGTPQHGARAWGEANGWAVREFRVTWESARALLDRGIPFAVSTAGSIGSHHQVVAGYDTRRGTLTVRCPSQCFLVEYLAESFIEEHRWTGPCGLVWIPLEQEEALAGIDLPDVQNHDDFHALQMALLAHRRSEAGEIQQRMNQAAPDHAMTIRARHLLAAYDADPVATLEAVDALIEKFPAAPPLLLGRLSLLGSLAPPAEYSRALTEVCARHRRDPGLQMLLARHLSLDPQQKRPARRMLRTFLRGRHGPPSASILFAFASTLDAEGRHDVAKEIGRFAACVEDKDETCAKTYFAAVQARGWTDEGLGLLQRRFEAYGHASGGPGITLVWALERLDRRTEALAVLERALSIRPLDTDLMLFAAMGFARRGRHDRAEELLAAARGGARRASWLRTAAVVAAVREDRVKALRLWREVLESEPWAADANHTVATLLAVAEGRYAGTVHLQSVHARFPRHQDLQKLWDAWERETEAIARAQARPEPQLARRNEEFGESMGRMLFPLLLFGLLQALGRSCV